MIWIQQLFEYKINGEFTLTENGWKLGEGNKSNILSSIDFKDKFLLIGPHFHHVLEASQQLIILHQIAHITASILGEKPDHDDAWLMVCKLLGIEKPDSVFEDEEFVRMCNGPECKIFNTIKTKLDE